MSDLISRQALLRSVWAAAVSDCTAGEDKIYIHRLLKLIEKASATDAEVLKCEHCKHNHERTWVDCELLPQMFGRTEWDNYCSLAEPKETDND